MGGGVGVWQGLMRTSTNCGAREGMARMESVERRKPRLRRLFTPELRADILERCRRGDGSIGQVARDFDLTETAVWECARQAEVDAGSRNGLTAEERRNCVGSVTLLATTRGGLWSLHVRGDPGVPGRGALAGA